MPLVPTALTDILRSHRRASRARSRGLAAALATALVAACAGGAESAKRDTVAAVPAPAGAGVHTHAAPQHGGMLIELGDGVAHLELVVDTAKGTMMAYVLDGAAKEPLRLTQGRIDLKMLDLVEGNVEVFTVLAGRASAKTGETNENTSVFLGFVPELKGRAHFRAVVQRVEVLGQVFTDIPVTYPPEARL